MLVVAENLVGGTIVPCRQRGDPVLNPAEAGDATLRPGRLPHAVETLAQRDHHRFGERLASLTRQRPRQTVRFVVLDAEGHGPIIAVSRKYVDFWKAAQACPRAAATSRLSPMPSRTASAILIAIVLPALTPAGRAQDPNDLARQ